MGDASAVQSPISFGGFCAMLRHLPRYTRGLDLALQSDRLSSGDLALLSPYLPNLGTAWMSAAAMTARALPPQALPVPSSGSASASSGSCVEESVNVAGTAVTATAPESSEAAVDVAAKVAADVDSAKECAQPYTLVNQLLEGNFKVMADLPRSEALTFFRDVTTFSTLLAVLVGQTATMAPLLPRVVAELVGPLELLEFSFHFLMLGVYTLLYRLVRAAGLASAAGGGAAAGGTASGSSRSPASFVDGNFDLSCARDALAYGSGLDGAPPTTSQPTPSPSPRAPPPSMSVGDGGEEGGEGDSRPWWRRPPPTWPPRIDDPKLVAGDVLAAYSSSFVAVTSLGGAQDASSEGAALAAAWSECCRIPTRPSCVADKL